MITVCHMKYPSASSITVLPPSGERSGKGGKFEALERWAYCTVIHSAHSRTDFVGLRRCRCRYWTVLLFDPQLPLLPMIHPLLPGLAKYHGHHGGG